MNRRAHLPLGLEINRVAVIGNDCALGNFSDVRVRLFAPRPWQMTGDNFVKELCPA
jgi:hypothetical protein